MGVVKKRIVKTQSSFIKLFPASCFYSIYLYILFIMKTKIQLGGGRKMAETIQWLEDMETALAEAQTKDLPILLFFHNPG